MNILGILPSYVPHSRVGAWITTHEYLAALARTHTVDVVEMFSDRSSFTIDGVRVHPRGTPVPRPDVVVTHLGDFPHILASAAAFHVPVVRMVHGYGHRELIDMFPADLIVYSSQAIAEDHDRPGIVAHPPVRARDYAVTPGARVTLANLSEAKGGYVLRTVARALPDVEFLGVNGWGPQVVNQPDNVLLVPPAEDMRDIYRHTRVLLMPSVRESYGRVGVEAACSGIPTIAHPSPGLREALGGAATWVNRRDIHGWVTAIERTLDNWDAASACARDAIQPDPDGTIRVVCDNVEALAFLAA